MADQVNIFATQGPSAPAPWNPIFSWATAVKESLTPEEYNQFTAIFLPGPLFEPQPWMRDEAAYGEFHTKLGELLRENPELLAQFDTFHEDAKNAKPEVEKWGQDPELRKYWGGKDVMVKAKEKLKEMQGRGELEGIDLGNLEGMDLGKWERDE